MLSNNIIIETEYKEVTSLLLIKVLEQIHTKLEIKKPIIFYFQSDEEVLQINIDSLNHDYYTDVITFDYEDDEDIEENEVVISIDRIKENASTLKQSLHTEIHRICIHAMLHLVGYKDSNELEKQKMTSQENHFLDLYCST